MKDFLVKLTATGLFSGLIRPFPGTWGTIPAWLIAWFILRGDQTAMIVATIVATGLSVWASTEAERMYGHDARKIVIDEWAGMFIALLFVPYALDYYVAAFLLFRVLDVVKIFPARQLEGLPRGWGITADDIAAGLQTNLILQIMIYQGWHFF